MEVFVFYTNESLIKDLTMTLEAWDNIYDTEIMAVEVPDKKYELIRRVTAENMANGDYIITDLGCVSEAVDIVKQVKEMFSKDQKIGMVRLSPNGGVIACRKGIIERWLPYKGGSYDRSHDQAYELEGYKVAQSKLTYKRLVSVN